MSNIYQIYLESYQFNRTRTLGLLDAVAALPDPQRALGWRPGPGRAHIGWQLMHIALTEDIFATERLAPHKQGLFTELWPRFRGGSTPDDNVPDAATIRRTLDESRRHLVATLSEYTEDRLSEIPESLKQRNLTVRDVLSVINWHEGHHQGQAHITLNLFKASQLS